MIGKFLGQLRQKFCVDAECMKSLGFDGGVMCIFSLNMEGSFSFKF